MPLAQYQTGRQNLVSFLIDSIVAFYLMSHENISAIHSHSHGFGGLCLSPGMMWWGIDG